MQNRGPWKVLNTKEVYRNPWISVREDEVIHPNGKPGIFGILTLKHGAGVLAIDKKGNAHLIKEQRYALNSTSFEVANGGIDEGENPLDAAKRELLEELGLVSDTWVDLGIFHPYTCVVECKSYLFLALNVEFEGHKRDDTEVIETFEISFDEAVNMVMDSKITQGESVATILKAKKYIEDNNIRFE